MVLIGAWPPTRTRPSGSSTAELWYERCRESTATGFHVFDAGSNSSACGTGSPDPGRTTSSRLAPLTASTSPVGSRTPEEYQRRWLSLPVASLAIVSPLVVS